MTHQIAQRTADLLATMPTPGTWPYGMPCPLYPELVIVGLSPGNSPAKNAPSPGPMLGPEAYKHFKYPDTKHYWKNMRALALAYFRRSDPDISEDDATKLTAHLNAGTASVGKATASTIEPAYLGWIARLLDGPLQPKTVVFLGYVKPISRPTFRATWDAAGGLRVNWTQRDEFVALTGSAYGFRRWRCTSSAGQLINLIIFPNHPSRRVPGHTWASIVAEFAQLPM